MRRVLAIVVALWSSAAAAETTASKQTVVFYNARLALRDGRPEDVLKLWLLRNSLLQQGERTREDADFRSVVWVALGRLGLCQDGFEEDEREGAGLWPIGLHNMIIQGRGTGASPSRPSPWNVFEVGRQQRLISLRDVLSAEELRSVTFFRTGCLLPSLMSLRLEGSLFPDLEERAELAWLLRGLLVNARATLVREKVRNLPVLEARIFDLDLVLAEQRERKARRDAQSTAQRARGVGIRSSF